MKIELVAFTENGIATARLAAEELQAENTIGISRCGGCKGLKLSDWAMQKFNNSDALIFVGAMGICVRAIAPFLKSKVTDPAVIVIDENAKFVISVLSGHIGGANLLAEKIAKNISAMPIITTATDCRGAFAIDSWAVQNGYKIENTHLIKNISATILNGEKVKIHSDFQILGTLPPELEISSGNDADILISVNKSEKLLIVPQILTLGVGCKKNTEKTQIEFEFNKLLCKNNLVKSAFLCVCSIDLKKNEQGLLDFCAEHELIPKFFSAPELMQAKGKFSASEFVLKTTGADNVCERAAALNGGNIIVEKQAENGITLAVAQNKFSVKF